MVPPPITMQSITKTKCSILVNYEVHFGIGGGGRVQLEKSKEKREYITERKSID